jgi:uncharacterized membrane protein YecN with MAPEG domain
MPHLTSLVTLLAVAMYFATGIRVGLARMRTGVAAPATTGHPDFDRAFRIQMNTLEWMPIFLPALWLTAFYVGDAWAAAGGAVWIAGRILYIVGYTRAAEKRSPGFGIQALAALALWLASLVAVLRALMG